MSAPTHIHDAKALELQTRSLDALVSLLHALDASSGVDDVAKRSLLTLSGQLLVRRSAFFVEDEGVLRLRATVGMGETRRIPSTWSLPAEIVAHFEATAGDVVDLGSIHAQLEHGIAENFDRLARLSNGAQTVGIVLLGGWLATRDLSEADRQLLRTMGVVIGTTLHRIGVQESLEEARRRLEQAQIIRKSVMDHVSHEFNTPLMVVKSTGDFLRDAPESERQNLLDMHAESVQRLEQLVESILSAARDVEESSPSPHFTLRQMIQDIVEPWLSRYAEGDDSLACLGANLVGHVQVDPMRVEMILKVLHSNARDASVGEHPKVWTNIYTAPRGWWEQQDHTARLAHYRGLTEHPADPTYPLRLDPFVAERADDREVIVEVVDVGRGIPEFDHESVFEPFTLATNSLSLGISGAGMGLPTARRLSEELGGKLLLRSEEGSGTVVALLLPVHDLEAGDPE